MFLLCQAVRDAHSASDVLTECNSETFYRHPHGDGQLAIEIAPIHGGVVQVMNVVAPRRKMVLQGAQQAGFPRAGISGHHRRGAAFQPLATLRIEHLRGWNVFAEGRPPQTIDEFNYDNTFRTINKRIPGLKLDHPRQLAVMSSLVRCSQIADGDTFTTAYVLSPSSELRISRAIRFAELPSHIGGTCRSEQPCSRTRLTS